MHAQIMLSMGGAGGGPPADPAEYWRIYMPGIPGLFDGLRHWQIAELQFNGAQATGGTPFASSSLESPPAAAAANAFDGVLVTNNVWSTPTSPTGPGEFLGYEFASAIAVTSVSVTARNHIGIAGPWTPANFIVQRSTDGVSFDDVWTVSTSAFIAGETKTFTF